MSLAFVLSYFLVFVTKRLMTLCLLMRDRKRINPDGRGGGKELGGVEGGKTIIRVYFVRRKKFHSQQKGGKEIGREQTVACGKFYLKGSQEEGCGI